MKILFLDIETAPNKCYMWSMWQELQSTEFIEKEWFILCWSAKWFNDKKIMSSALPDFKDYNKDSENDKAILEKLCSLLDEADVVVTHNGLRFDHRKILARFIYHGIKPPSPYKTIDTCVIAKQLFGFTSNKLNDIVKFLKLGQKMSTGGFQLWKDCLNGNKQAWFKMVKYCKHDIILLEKVYLALRPYILNHPNFGVFNEDNRVCCPTCGSDRVHSRGYYFTQVSKFQRFKCTNCGAWSRKRLNELSKDKKKSLITSI